jgi:hypothetical protein
MPTRGPRSQGTWLLCKPVFRPKASCSFTGALAHGAIVSLVSLSAVLIDDNWKGVYELSVAYGSIARFGTLVNCDSATCSRARASKAIAQIQGEGSPGPAPSFSINGGR